MERYQRTDLEDYLLAQWWVEITLDGSRDQLFVPPTTLGQMLAYFQNDVSLIYERDDRLWFAMWFTPMFSGLSASLWCRRDRRGSRAFIAAAEWAYETALQAVPVLLGVTTQPKLLKVHERLGYTIVGSVPGLIDGKMAWIVALTRDGWQRRKSCRTQGVAVG